MAKTRIVDYMEVAYGKEPLADIPLSKKLNWYSAVSSCDDKKKWAIEYFNKTDRIIAKKLSKIDKQWFTTLGSLCRIRLQGGSLGLFGNQRFDEMTNRIIENQYDPTIKVQTKAPKLNRMELEKKMQPLDDLFDLVDGIIDKSTLGEKFTMPTLVDGISNAWIIETANHYKDQLSEIQLAMSGLDKELAEGYSNYNKSKFKRVIKTYKDIDDLFNQYIIRQKNLKAQSRKPRVMKSKPAGKLVEKLNYMKSCKDLGLVSCNPMKIIGANKLFVYNTKTRKLSEYVAFDSTGLSVKGSTLTSISDKSYSKTIRKPEEFFKSFVGSTIFKQTKQLDFIKAVKSTITGRINKDCILISCK